MTFRHPTAHKPMFGKIGVVSGTCLETGAATSRAVSLAVPCAIHGGAVADAANQGAFAANPERDYIVVFTRADWVDHMPPQIGYTVTAAGYPVLRVRAVVGDEVRWSLNCTAKGVL
jgi:hypothetical protein